MGTLNVRLGEEDTRRVRELRNAGVSISEVVRSALRQEVARGRQRRVLDVDGLLAEMKARFPATPLRRAAALRIDTTDRRQVARAIRERLQRRR